MEALVLNQDEKLNRTVIVGVFHTPVTHSHRRGQADGKIHWLLHNDERTVKPDHRNICDGLRGLGTPGLFRITALS